MTFSVVAYCPETRSHGIAITSSSMSVAARCAWVQSGVGAVATQNLTNPLLGPLGLELLARGLAEDVVLDMLLVSDPGREWRQVMVMGPEGVCALHTGEHALPAHAQGIGLNCAAAGNLLADAEIPALMVAGVEQAAGKPLAQRLLVALHAGLRAGGEVRALQSAGLLVADGHGWQTVNLRVDHHDRPLSELQRLWDLYEPLQSGYVSRVTEPQRYQPS